MPSGVYIRTDEIRAKLRQRNMAHLTAFAYRKGSTPHNKGKQMSLDAREKMSASKTGKPSPRRGVTLSPETREKMSANLKGRVAWNKGLPCPERSGPNHPRWVPDRSSLKVENRKHDSYHKIWRRAVYSRDKYTCRLKDQTCKGRIEAHHIERYHDSPSLRYEVSNGITLCAHHHPRKRELERALAPTFKKIIESSCQYLQ